ncbi:MAG: LysR substrate-binding domain-containing protein [Steroidobacteraceae bacterium]
MKLSHLRNVIAVADRGSLRRAARHLGLAQPAITRSIQEVERELGVALFERRARGMILTPMGELFRRRANAVQGELRRARDEIDQLLGKATGRVSVCLSTLAHIAFLPGVLQPFRARFPNVVLDISESMFPGVEAALNDGTLDFYVGPLADETLSKDLTVEKLFDNTRVIFGRKGHPLAGARSLRDLIDARWITTSVTAESVAELEPLFALHGLPAPRIELHAHSALTMIIAAANSDLLMMLPRQWHNSRWTSALLDSFTVPEVLPAPPMCIVTRTKLPLTPAAQCLCDLLRRESSQYATTMPSAYRSNDSAIF